MVLDPDDIVTRLYDYKQYTHLEEYEKGWIYGVWYCGTAFQKAEYYGQFPMTFVNRIRAGFPPDQLDFLHLCCGMCNIEGAMNVDVRDDVAADTVADAQDLPFDDETYDVCLIDPPYSQEDSSRYGVPRLISSKKTMAEVCRVLRPGGWLLWLDEKYPTHNKKCWDLQGLIGIVTGANRRARLLSMFRKHGPWSGEWKESEDASLQLRLGLAGR